MCVCVCVCVCVCITKDNKDKRGSHTRRASSIQSSPTSAKKTTIAANHESHTPMPASPSVTDDRISVSHSVTSASSASLSAPVSAFHSSKLSSSSSSSSSSSLSPKRLPVSVGAIIISSSPLAACPAGADGGGGGGGGGGKRGAWDGMSDAQFLVQWTQGVVTPRGDGGDRRVGGRDRGLRDDWRGGGVVGGTEGAHAQGIFSFA